ncbi:MAG TPA: RNA methyltransferase [Pyrinomonadaceae bacterium]|nr:RNA methyltransferase [Pyrinomonadaceae bacterium]
MKISSRDNPLLRQARSVRDGKTNDLIFVEGLRLAEEALHSGLEIEAVIYSDEVAEKERAARFLEAVASVCNRMASVNEKLLATISYTKTPQGIILLAKQPESGKAKLEMAEGRTPLLVILHGINNPVNVGAIMRSAEAAGATGVITTANTADLFSSKSLRGAMGSAFRLPIWRGASYGDALSWCTAHNIKTVCADVKASALYTDINWTTPTALIVGPESTGLSLEEVAAADEAVRIGMLGEVESLNVGVAAGILLYEAARQRR